MPTYSYRCTQCNHAFDIHQAFTDDNLTVCPNCGGTLRKVFSPVGVAFSGSGFYRNDSRPAPQSEGKAESAPKSETKTETKSETKSETKKPDSKPAS
jgi:putative FmdB family regulatory protein